MTWEEFERGFQLNEIFTWPDGVLNPDGTIPPAPNEGDLLIGDPRYPEGREWDGEKWVPLSEDE